MVSPWTKYEADYEHWLSIMFTFIMCTCAVLVLIGGFVIHDLLEEKNAAFTLTAQANLDKLHDGKTIRIDDYTILGTVKDAETSSSGAQKQYCVLGVLDENSTEVKYMILSDIGYSTLDVANINQHDPILGTPLTLYHVPVQGILTATPDLAPALREDLLTCLRESEIPEAELDSKLLSYTLSETQMTQRKHFLLRFMNMKTAVILLAIFASITAISTVITLRMRKKRKGIIQAFLENNK